MAQVWSQNTRPSNGEVTPILFSGFLQSRSSHWKASGVLMNGAINCKLPRLQPIKGIILDL
jgi:hypothetical protein